MVGSLQVGHLGKKRHKGTKAQRHKERKGQRNKDAKALGNRGKRERGELVFLLCAFVPMSLCSWAE
jgi:hypothetical protein